MPKEIAHWVIAQQVMDRLPAGGLADAVRQHPNCLHLGAVFHDVGYYGQGAEAVMLEGLADRLHGAQGEDTNEILRRLAPAGAQLDAKPWLTAFFVGLVSHIIADRHLHPLVYYFTGNYYASDPQEQRRAATAHRRLEGLMDLRLTGGLAGVKRFSLRRILRDLEVPATDLVEEVAGALATEASPLPAAPLVAALGFFSKVQWLARRPLLVKILGLPLRLKPSDRENLNSLTYFAELESFMGLLDEPLDYRNPLTGESHRLTLSGAIEDIVEECAATAATLAGGHSELDHGASLEMGIASTRTADARYFHPYVLAQDYDRVGDFEMLRSPG